jgi:hypothetical protein
MRIKKVWAIVLGICISHTAIWSQTTFDKVKLYQDDIDTLVSWVENLHPLPFARISEGQWKTVISEARELITENPSDFTMTLAAADILNSLQDSHTGLSLGEWMSKRNEICGRNLLYFTSTKDGVFIQTDMLDLIETGSKVIEINGKPILEVAELAIRLSPQEGNSLLSRRRVGEYFLIESALINETHFKGSVEIVIEDFAGSLITIDYPLLTKRAAKKIYRGIDTPDVVEWVWSNRFVRLNINSFMDGRTFKFTRHINKGFAQLIDLYAEGEVEGLVIDLRGNWGGLTGRMEYVFSFLSDAEFAVSHALVVKQCEESKADIYKKYRGVRKWAINKWENEVEYFGHLKRMSELEIGGTDTIFNSEVKLGEFGYYSGPTSLLIDGTSISASVAFASAFIRLDRGEVFGEECMGPMGGTFANPISRTLPNSEFSVTISTGKYCLKKDLVLGSSPIKPNRWVQISEDDLLDGDDPTHRALEDWLDYPMVSIRYDFNEPESKSLFRELETIYSEDPEWSGAIRKKVFDIIIKSDKALSELRKKIKEVESSSHSEEEILKSMINLNNLKKDIRADRKDSIKLYLHQSLQPQFDVITGVNRPSVLHFGIHNRLDCNVCLPKK